MGPHDRQATPGAARHLGKAAKRAEPRCGGARTSTTPLAVHLPNELREAQLAAHVGCRQVIEPLADRRKAGRADRRGNGHQLELELQGMRSRTVRAPVPSGASRRSN